MRGSAPKWYNWDTRYNATFEGSDDYTYDATGTIEIWQEGGFRGVCARDGMVMEARIASILCDAAHFDRYGASATVSTDFPPDLLFLKGFQCRSDDEDDDDDYTYDVTSCSYDDIVPMEECGGEGGVILGCSELNDDYPFDDWCCYGGWGLPTFPVIALLGCILGGGFVVIFAAVFLWLRCCPPKGRNRSTVGVERNIEEASEVNVA